MRHSLPYVYLQPKRDHHRSSRKQHRLSVLIVTVVAFALAPIAAATESPTATSWTKKSFAVQGTWTITEDQGTRYLVLSDDFKTRSAPDLKLFLSRHSVEEAGNRNATDQALLIAPLRSNKGGQRYALPDDLDLGQYTSLLLHCERYSKLWAAAKLPTS